MINNPGKRNILITGKKIVLYIDDSQLCRRHHPQTVRLTIATLYYTVAVSAHCSQFCAQQHISLREIGSFDNISADIRKNLHWLQLRKNEYILKLVRSFISASTTLPQST